MYNIIPNCGTLTVNPAPIAPDSDDPGNSGSTP